MTPGNDSGEPPRDRRGAPGPRRLAGAGGSRRHPAGAAADPRSRGNPRPAPLGGRCGPAARTVPPTPSPPASRAGGRARGGEASGGGKRRRPRSSRVRPPVMRCRRGNAAPCPAPSTRDRRLRVGRGSPGCAPPGLTGGAGRRDAAPRPRSLPPRRSLPSSRHSHRHRGSGKSFRRSGRARRSRSPSAPRCAREPPRAQPRQGHPCSMALAARAEELLRAGRKAGALYCSPCSLQPGGGMSRPRLLSFLLLLLCCQGPSAQITDYLFESWKAYSEECQRNMSRLPTPTELVCNRTFDKFSCWPDTLPNRTASVPCPWFLPWYQKVKHRHVFKTCGPDGQWVMGPQGQSLRNATQCELDAEDLKVQENFAKTYGSFKVMYTVGYSVSLCALLLALALLLGFSKLHCMRNYIHMNLFASFILKGVSVLVIDALLKTHYSDKIDDYNVHIWLSDEYGIVANYCWLLVEGIYLHNLLVVAVFSERSYFTLYLCIGWGAPMLFLIPWVIVKFLYENIQCWTTNNNMGFWWILRFPVFLAILINFFIFIRIIQILVSKLRAHQMRYTDYKFRLAKSTLTLIPLLGIHEVVFAFVTDEHAQGTLRYVKLFFDLFLSSFQGMLVAILYCFVNKEVQAELLKRWQRWKLGKDLAEEYKHTYSHAPSARNGAGSACEKHQLVSGCANGLGRSPVPAHPGTRYLERTGRSTAEHLPLGDRHHCYEFPETTAESHF
ncbi:glucagon receptor isoform X2 [Falco rusticolus]|uniref:glucagon receptor isoform X2 n=2 Tax=Falco TaxID=8952 RepID=UPI0018869223|nr:glucagon receptor isoform X2 [Falco rusticolus]